MTLKNMTKNKIVVIVGPTCTNKTKLAIKLAKKINGEIINADAFQVYKQLNIGVNKPSKEQLREVKFHLISNININDKWDIKRFQDEANKLINQLINNGKTPIVVGGSHLYIDALIKNYDLSLFVERNNEFENFSTQELFEKFKSIDSKKAQSINNNRQRLIRALQIYTHALSNSPMNKTKSNFYDSLIIFCNADRNLIYEKINRRVDEMFKCGWIEEVKQLMNQYKDINKLNAFKAIGYLYIYDAIINNTKVDVDKIKQHTRQYAKRQLTWIKHHYDSPLVFNQNNIDEIIDKTKTWLTN